MPLTPFQSETLRLLAKNRNPESYIAGATVINRLPDSPRYSSDIDVFHDPAASVLVCSTADRELLQASGYAVEILLETRGFVRALVRFRNEGIRLEWASDTAFRFFPVIPDPEMGFRLHEIDAAINKCLALASRTEARDVIDMLTIHDTLLHVGACCWAACGKDPGYTPELILEMIARNARLTPDLLALENLQEKVDPRVIKSRWSAALTDARELIEKFNPDHLGCLFVSAKGEVKRVPPKGATRHFGSVRGAWPQL